MAWFTTAIENMFVDKDAQPFGPSEIIKVNHESNGRYRAWNFKCPCTLFSSQEITIPAHSEKHYKRRV